MTGTGNAVATERGSESSVVALENVFVSIDCDRNVAYVAYETESMIRWHEIPCMTCPGREGNSTRYPTSALLRKQPVITSGRRGHCACLDCPRQGGMPP